MKRTTIIIRDEDYQYLQILSDTFGELGVSPTIRMILKRFVEKHRAGEWQLE